MNNKEFEKLRNDLAIKAIIKIIGYTIICILCLGILLDGILNDELATDVSSMSKSFYYFCVQNKILIMSIIYMLAFSIISFLVIRNMNIKIVEILEAIDTILKEPEKETKLSDDLIIIENKLNKIRLNLITNKNIAKESETKKNNLIMYMAHDLKTPLTSVIGYLNLLTQEKELPQNMQEKYMNIVLQKALRVEELTNQFFEITRYNLYDIPINKEEVDLTLLLEQLVDECYPMLNKRGLKCILNVPKRADFLGDGDKLARAFDNLLKNAINYSYENSKIEIILIEKTDKIEIVFKNKGEKIPKYKLDKIFEKFYRVNESRASNTGGTGLGLAITKEIIELHNGNITVKNNDEFIEFYIELKKSK